MKGMPGEGMRRKRRYFCTPKRRSCRSASLTESKLVDKPRSSRRVGHAFSHGFHPQRVERPLLTGPRHSAATRRCRAGRRPSAATSAARLLRMGDHDNDGPLPSVRQRCAWRPRHPTLVMGRAPGL